MKLAKYIGTTITSGFILLTLAACAAEAEPEPSTTLTDIFR
jgi:hypothetical protein